ncbi:acyltransferase [Actinomadura vinacea]|uniref:Acyltransferase n=1 Tax=Actinomadura vinacea TaxID=115336 RepID=A0ABP5W2X6_9ACTN
MPDRTRRARLPSLTGLRFVLAGIVLACHTLGFVDGSLRDAAVMTFPIAATAVSGFFILSGFVLTWTHTVGDRARSFWRRRFWRIFPNHALSWTAAVVLFSVAAPPPQLSSFGEPPFYAAFLGLFMVQDWIARLEVNTAYNGPAWSLSCEAFFYAMFPLLISAVRRVPRRRLRYLWAALAIAALGLPLVAMTIPGPPPAIEEFPVNQNSLWFGYVFPPVRLVEFALGIVTARLLQTGRWPRLPRLAIIASLALAIGLLGILPLQYALGAATAVPMTLIVAGLALADVQGRSGQLARPLLVRLGEASYALYICHFPLLLALSSVIGPQRSDALWVNATLAVAFTLLAQAVALAVHRYYEQPLTTAWSRRRPPSLTTHRDQGTEAPGTSTAREAP